MIESKIYTHEGYLDIDRIMLDKNPFIFLVGARGIGKSFGILRFLLNEYTSNKKKFIYMRRTEAEIDYCATEEGNPFKPINAFLKINVEVRKVNSAIRGFFLQDECIGYCMALSTFYSKRSVSFEDIDFLFFDEFIPEVNARPIKHEAEAFFNSVETIARNRELISDKSLKVICASNSNTLDNPLFLELGIVNKALKMVKKKQVKYIDDKRGFTLLMPFDSPISKKKENTSLYKLTSKSKEFLSMSLKNEWNDDISDNVKSKNLKQFAPLVNVGELFIYKHKQEKIYYITTFKTGTFNDVFTTGQIDIQRFKKSYQFLWFAYMKRLIYFESYNEQLIFEKYFSLIK